MNKALKKVSALAFALMMLAGALAGCGNTTSSSTASTASQASSTSGADSTASGEAIDKPYEGVVLKYAVSDTQAQGGETVELVELVKEKTGIILEFTIIPNTSAGEVDKALVMLQAGDELDILYKTTPGMKPFYSAGVLTPVDDLAKAAGYDMKAVFGSNLPVMMDGGTYGLPAFNDIWLTLYNKKIFDDNNVPYPTAEGWTWDKYIETAKKLTDTSKDIWGSFMLDYDCYNYMLAHQNGAEPYTKDGMANFDDPRYAESLEFFYGLGNTEKIQPDSVSYAAGLHAWNSFVGEGNKAMWVIGGWATSMLTNTEKYPRDWQAGIVPMPYPEGQTPSTLAVTGCYTIPSTSKNKEAAFEAIRVMAEEQYTLGHGRIPARVDLTDAEIEAYITDTLIPNYKLDGFTVEDIKTCWFDPGRNIIPEKIIGTADVVINKIWSEEGPMYGQGGKSLENAIKAIQERSNKAIEEEKNTK